MKLLEREKLMMQKATQMTDDEDIDEYVEKLEMILKRRRELDDLMLGKLQVFKDKLKEEEEEHFRMTKAEGK